jgi:hypothetical protein
MTDMEILEKAIVRIEASIDEYDEADTSVVYDSVDAITNAGYKSEAIETLLQLFERHPLVQHCLNNSEKQCLIFVTGQGGGRRQCGGIVD